MDCDEGVFAFDGEGSVRTTVPFEQSAAAAFEAIRELEGLLEPASDAEAMVSAMHGRPGPDRPVQRPRSPQPALACHALASADAHYPCRRPAPPPPHHHLAAHCPPAVSQLARHVELAAGGAHRVDPAYLAAVLQRLGYSAKLHESSAALAKFKRGVRHQFITVPLPGE